MVSYDPYKSPEQVSYPPRMPMKGGGTNGMAVGSLVLGVIGITALFLGCCCGPLFLVQIPLSITAVALGHLARAQIEREGGDGAELALGGLILGYVSIGMSVIGIIWFVVMIVMSSNNQFPQ